MTTPQRPDRVIGKKESRSLRNEHNALVNSHNDLLTACENILASSGLIGNQTDVLEAMQAMNTAVSKSRKESQ